MRCNLGSMTGMESSQASRSFETSSCCVRTRNRRTTLSPLGDDVYHWTATMLSKKATAYRRRTMKVSLFGAINGVNKSTGHGDNEDKS